MNTLFRVRPSWVTIAGVLAAGMAVQATVRADAVVFPRIASGDGFATFIQLTNTANIAAVVNGGGTGVPLNSAGGPYQSENLRFVYNINSTLVNTSGNQSLAGCNHVELPGRTASKDTMFFEATSGTGQVAASLLPDDANFGGEASVAPRIPAPAFGTLAVSNSWTGYEPQAADGTQATGVWTGVGPGDLGEPNEGTLFGQAWVIDFTNLSMTAYNAFNDPLEATTFRPDFNGSAFQDPEQSSFNTNMPDQYLMQWLPTYGGALNTTYHVFPFAFDASYLSVTPPNPVTLEIGRNLTATQNNSQNGVSLSQDGFWNHQQQFFSGVTTITVPCGGISVPLANLVDPSRADALRHSGGVAYANIAARNIGTTSTPNYVRDAGLILKQVDVIGGFSSLVAEPGAIHLDTNAAGPAAAAKATPDAPFCWTHC